MNGTKDQEVQQDETPANPVVYSTVTGEEPRGGLTRTQEATELPPPTRVARKTTTKKHRPRVRAAVIPLHKEIKWDPDHWAEAQAAVRPGERLVIDSDLTAHTEYLR